MTIFTYFYVFLRPGHVSSVSPAKNLWARFLATALADFDADSTVAQRTSSIVLLSKFSSTGEPPGYRFGAHSVRRYLKCRICPTFVPYTHNTSLYCKLLYCTCVKPYLLLFQFCQKSNVGL